MSEQTKMEPRIKITHDEMEAYLKLLDPGEGKYTLSDLQDALLQKGVLYGINEKVLQDMVSRRAYDREILVAKGTSLKEGKDGYYDYHFNRDLDEKPKIRPDGTVDYWSINKVEIVKEGQLIATYHPAIQGTNGSTVKGKPLMAKRARELPPLKGKGFARSEDGLSYNSLIDGKIEIQGDRIVILNVYEIGGDADLSVGHIDFRGDVIVHGNVRGGVSIKASGSITVDGIVETAQLTAGKDIILRGGMMGGSKASIFTKGNITAKFFEYTKIEAWGDIQADVFLSCEVICRQKIILSGKKASIVGGQVSAVQGIEVSNLGSDIEIRTEVQAGIEPVVIRRIKVLKKSIASTQELLEKVEKGLSQLKLLEEQRGTGEPDPRKAQLLRVKIRDAATLSASKMELKELENQVEASKGVKISVADYVYPGVMVRIDGFKIYVIDQKRSVEFVKGESDIEVKTWIG